MNPKSEIPNNEHDKLWKNYHLSIKKSYISLEKRVKMNYRCKQLLDSFSNILLATLPGSDEKSSCLQKMYISQYLALK